MSKLDELERCATAALVSSPAPWKATGGLVDDATGEGIAETDDETADHISAADPATVLALVRVVRAAMADDRLDAEAYADLRSALEAFREVHP